MPLEGEEERTWRTEREKEEEEEERQSITAK